MNIKWKVSRFEELSVAELYEIMKVRMEVFVVEQHCFYLDMDDEDQYAYHLQGFLDDRLVAYSRIFPRGTHYEHAASIGRVIVRKEYRMHKLGRTMIEFVTNLIDTDWREKDIHISAQTYLVDFYRSFGFVAVGDEYMDAGVLHIMMKRHT